MRFTKLLIALLLFASPIAAQQGNTVGRYQGVDLIEIAKVNESGRPFGADYMAWNKTNKPVVVNIRLTTKKNVFDGLVWMPLRVEAGQRIYLGWVTQSDYNYDAGWEYEWNVAPPPTSP